MPQFARDSRRICQPIAFRNSVNIRYAKFFSRLRLTGHGTIRLAQVKILASKKKIPEWKWGRLSGLELARDLTTSPFVRSRPCPLVPRQRASGDRTAASALCQVWKSPALSGARKKV